MDIGDRKCHSLPTNTNGSIPSPDMGSTILLERGGISASGGVLCVVEFILSDIDNLSTRRFIIGPICSNVIPLPAAYPTLQ